MPVSPALGPSRVRLNTCKRFVPPRRGKRKEALLLSVGWCARLPAAIGAMGKAISLLVLIAVLQYVRAFPDSDAISSLPDYGPPPTRQWSGFLNGKGTQVAPGCASTEAECQLHYWFAEADHEPAKKPVVLWLNGGPGSSSILGMLQEQGPLIINSTGGLMRNPYAWTTLVNLLILERF